MNSVINVASKFLNFRADDVSNALINQNASMEHARATMTKDLEEYCKYISLCVFEGDSGLGTLPCTSRLHFEIWSKLRKFIEGFRSLRKDFSTNNANNKDNPLRKQILNWISSLNDIIFDKGYQYIYFLSYSD
jgi:hypothetical protein